MIVPTVKIQSPAVKIRMAELESSVHMEMFPEYLFKKKKNAEIYKRSMKLIRKRELSMERRVALSTFNKKKYFSS